MWQIYLARTTEEPECGDNKNSGPRGPIQCTSNSDCCDGAKCTPINGMFCN